MLKRIVEMSPGRSDFCQEAIMTFVVAQRITSITRWRGQSMLHAGRLLTNRFYARVRLTPQERANLYVSRMPIAVLGVPNGESSGKVENR
jgi:hypothetical protein